MNIYNNGPKVEDKNRIVWISPKKLTEELDLRF